MTPNERKAEMVRRGRRPSQIADALEVSRSHVSQVIAGKRRSPRVERAIAEAIGQPVERVFPSAA